MRHITILILLNLCAFLVSGQKLNQYYKSLSEAQVLSKQGLLDSALAIYDSAFETVEYVHIMHLNQALILAKKINDSEKIVRYTNNIIKKNNSYDIFLSKLIDSLSEEDQRVRSRKFIKAAKFVYEKQNLNSDSKKYKKSLSTTNEWLKVDSCNINYLIDLFKLYGFVGEELVGTKRASYVHRLLIHFDRDINNSTLDPFLKIALSEGKLLPLSYSQIIDRHLYFQTGSQLYWTWPISVQNEIHFSQEQIEKIYKLRESIGIYNSHFSIVQKSNYWILLNEYN